MFLVGMFTVGSLWFFVLIIAACVLMLAAVEYEKAGWATVSLGVTFLCLALWGDFNILNVAKQHPWQALLAVALYFVSGVLWSIGKWWFFCNARKEKYKELRAEYVAQGRPDLRPYKDNSNKDANIIDAEKFEAFCLHSATGVRSSSDKYHQVWLRPKAHEHKSRIMTWMTYWPWSMLWTLVSDPTKRIFKALYTSVQKVFESIARRAYRDIDPMG